MHAAVFKRLVAEWYISLCLCGQKRRGLCAVCERSLLAGRRESSGDGDSQRGDLTTQRFADNALLGNIELFQCLYTNGSLSVEAMSGLIYLYLDFLDGLCCSFHCTIIVTVPPHMVIRVSRIHVSVASCDDMTVEVRDITKPHQMLYWTCWWEMPSRVRSSSNGVIIKVTARHITQSELDIIFLSEDLTHRLEMAFTNRMKGKFNQGVPEKKTKQSLIKVCSRKGQIKF